MIENILGGIGIVFVLGVVLALALISGIVWYFYMKVRYKTVLSNEAMIVTGKNLGDESKEKNIYKDDEGRYMKVIRGGGHKLRLFQTATRISLKSFQLEIKTPKVYTRQGVGIYGEAVATVKVADTLKGIVTYAEQFLGKKQDEIEHEITEVLSSNLRAILSKMSVEEINSDREGFNEAVREVAQEQLDRMGFKITSLGLSDLRDDDGYLENLGRPQVSEVRKVAEIAESENKRETEIKQAEVDEEVSREKFQREMNIADVRKEKELKDARILAETQKEKAIAEASYELEQEERRLDIEQRRLAIKEQEKVKELRILEMERENDVKLQRQQVELEKQQVEVRKQQAEADYYAKIKEAEALAKARISEGDAEAEVIKKKSMAEVEAIEKRAEAMAKHQDVILKEKMIGILPEYARAISESLSNVESIRIMDGGSGGQINTIPKTVTNTMTSLQESLKQMTGFDLVGTLNGLTGAQEDSSDQRLEINQDMIDSFMKKQHKEFIENNPSEE